MSRKVSLPSISILRSSVMPQLLHSLIRICWWTLEASIYSWKLFSRSFEAKQCHLWCLMTPLLLSLPRQVKTKATTLRQDGHFMDLQNLIAESKICNLSLIHPPVSTPIYCTTLKQYVLSRFWAQQSLYLFQWQSCCSCRSFGSPVCVFCLCFCYIWGSLGWK